MVVDRESPAVACPGTPATASSGQSSTSLTVAAEKGGIHFTTLTSLVGVADNADADADLDLEATVMSSSAEGGLPPADKLPIGRHNVSFSATDAAGNVGGCMVMVMVRDEEPPKIDCSLVAQLEFSTDPGASTKATALPTLLVVATDNTGLAPTITVSHSGVQAFPIGRTLVRTMLSTSPYR